MFPAATKKGGQNFAFPDVCKTPAPPAPSPVPIPYPNMAMLNNAKGNTCSKKVKICKKKVITKKSVIKSSTGDEPGTAGGIISNKNRGESTFRMGSFRIKVEGHPIVYLTCMTGQNGRNANIPVGCHVAPSQTKVIIIP